ncbi:hypothetical protein ACVXG7_12885 [Enterobacter hormaechei]
MLWSQFPLLAVGTLLGTLVGTFLVQKLSNTLLQIIFLYFYGLYHIWITDQERS